jgi:hypothetical protein
MFIVQRILPRCSVLSTIIAGVLGGSKAKNDLLVKGDKAL